MAIKGKRRARGRSGRTVATAPRPFLVRPKTPLMRRTGTKFVLVLLIETALFGLLVLGDLQTEADRRRLEIAEFTSLVEGELFGSGAAQQGFGAPLVLPQLGQALVQLQSGQVEKALSESAESWSDMATRAGEGIGKIEAESLALKEARNQMEQGLLLYASVADELRIATDVDERIQKDLATTIGEQFQLAGAIFGTGYGKLQEEQRKAGLTTESTFPTAPGGQLPGP